MFTAEQTALLQAKLDKSNIRSRSQGGREVFYIEAWQATAECNTVFGFDGWDHETVDLRVVAEGSREIGQNKVPGYGVSYVCKVRVTVRAGDTLVVREGVGAGHGIDRDLGQAHESAVKEAESDALKRALKSFGWRFGLALYDKDQEHVGSNADVEALSAQLKDLATQQAVRAWGKAQQDAINSLDEAAVRRIAAEYKAKLASFDDGAKIAAE